MINAMTVDVEEYFHPAEVQLHLDPSVWPTLPLRVDHQLGPILDLFDNYNVRATFFILGWLAENNPAAVRRIVERGHEIACHSYAHQLVYSLTPNEFRNDTMRAISVIEDACGVTPIAYRAPSYSITNVNLWALEVLVECGFTYDSSIYPIAHDRYGIPGFGRHATIMQTPSGPIQEIPIGTVKLGKEAVAPIGGGGYLRLLPYRYTAAGIRRVNNDEGKPVCIYFHPWEIDPEQPRLATGVVSRLRTYTGLSSMHSKIERLLKEFSFSTLSAVYGSTGVEAAAAAGK